MPEYSETTGGKNENPMPDKGKPERLRYLSEQFSYHLQPRKADWEAMHEDLKMVMGDQWDEDEKAKLKAKGKGAYNLNLISPLVDTVCGYERENRREVVGRPKKHDRKYDAEVVTEAIRDNDRLDDAEYVISDAADSAFVGGEGILGRVYSHEEGRHVMAAETPFAHVPDRDCLDLTWKGSKNHFKFRWMPRGEMKINWPGKAAAIEAMQPSVDVNFEGQIEAAFYKGILPEDTDFKSTNMLKPVPDADPGKYRDFFDDKRKRWRVIEAWEKTFVPVDVIMERIGYEDGSEDGHEVELTEVPWDIDDGEFKPKTEFIRKIVERLDNFRVKEKARRKAMWRLTVFAGDVILSDGLTSYPRLPFLPVFAKFRHDGERKFFHGLVRPLRDAQKIFNKSMSQQVYIINKAAGSVNFINEDVVNQVGDAKIQAAFSGFNDYIPVDPELLKSEYQIYRRVEQNTVPESLFVLPQMSKQLINDISGLDSLAFMGMEEPGDPSGFAIELRQRQNILRIATAFDNLDRSRRAFYRDLVWPQIKRDRKYRKRIMRSDLTIESLKAGRVDLPVNIPYSELSAEELEFIAQREGVDLDEIQKRIAENRVYNDLSNIDADIVLDTLEMSPTERMRSLSVLLKIAEKFGPEVVPIDLILEYTDSSVSERLKKRMAVGPQGEGPPPQDGTVQPTQSAPQRTPPG